MSSTNYILVGKFGSGKDTVASMIPGVIRIAFADQLKLVCRLVRQRQITMAYEIMYQLFNGHIPAGMYADLVKFSEYPPEEGKDRVLLQHLGTDWARKHDPDVWVRGVRQQLKPGNSYVITDCRFPNELAAFPDYNSIYISTNLDSRRWRIELRDGYFNDKWLEHDSERYIEEMAEECDFFVMNDGTKKDLEKQVKQITEYVNGQRVQYQTQLPLSV